MVWSGDNGIERERGALVAWNPFHMMSDSLSWNHYETPPRQRDVLRSCECVHVSGRGYFLVVHNCPLISAHKQLSFSLTKQLGPKLSKRSHPSNFQAASKPEDLELDFPWAEREKLQFRGSC